MEQMSQSRSLRFAFISVLLTSLSFLLVPAGRTAYQPEVRPEKRRATPSGVLTPLSYLSLVAEYHGAAANTDRTVRRLPGSNQPGIHEEIPDKYMARYQQWKNEFLATETGRQQWDFYKNNPNFTLTLIVTRDNPAGGTTSNYKWNQAGELVAATITLGCRLDVGVPNPVYFPVMNSLVPTETTHRIDGETLAATKMAHEFGHVNRTAKGDPVRYQLQGQLMPQYNQIFLSNGRNIGDPRLVDLASRMGGTPVEIWEDREYWGETNAMLYLRDRYAEDAFRCLLFSRIKRSVDLYAPSYEERFLNIAQSTPAARHCGW
jgi:YD repeat-containing protein